MSASQSSVLRAVVLRTGPSIEALLDHDPQGLGPLGELTHVKDVGVEVCAWGIMGSEG